MQFPLQLRTCCVELAWAPSGCLPWFNFRRQRIFQPTPTMTQQWIQLSWESRLIAILVRYTVILDVWPDHYSFRLFAPISWIPESAKGLRRHFPPLNPFIWSGKRKEYWTSHKQRYVTMQKRSTPIYSQTPISETLWIAFSAPISTTSISTAASGERRRHCSRERKVKRCVVGIEMHGQRRKW